MAGPGDFLELPSPQLFCPVYHLRPAAVARTHFGYPIFLMRNGEEVLKPITLARCSSAPGLIAGQWHSSADSFFLNVGREEARTTISGLVEAPEDGTSGSE